MLINKVIMSNASCSVVQSIPENLQSKMKEHQENDGKLSFGGTIK